MIQPSNPTKVVMFHRISSHVDQVKKSRIEFIQLCPQVGGYMKLYEAIETSMADAENNAETHKTWTPKVA
jgi:hypothetical protein